MIISDREIGSKYEGCLEGVTEKLAPVSVIIPCYRCSDTIGRAIKSVVEQSLKPAEIIVIDDYSDDNGRTIEAIEIEKRKFRDVLTIKLYKLSHNSGPSRARNIGIDSTNQDYVAFLDADDAWHQKKIEIQYNWMIANPDVAISSHFTVRKEGVTHTDLPREPKARKIEKYGLIFRNWFPTRTVMMKSTLPHRFPEEKRLSEDYYLWLSILLDGYSGWCLELPMAYSFKEDFGDSGLTKNLWELEKGEIDTYYQLYRSGRLSIIEIVLAVVISMIKYARRIMINKRRSLRQR